MVRVLQTFQFEGQIYLPDDILDVPDSETIFLGTVLEAIQATPIPETETKPPRRPPRKTPTPEAV